MDAELNRLEARIEQLISQYAVLRDEYRELLTVKARLETENDRLAGKVKLAAEKLETLFARLPQA
jgi:predicted nuclease with TOPRIM domain